MALGDQEYSWVQDRGSSGCEASSLEQPFEAWRGSSQWPGARPRVCKGVQLEESICLQQTCTYTTTKNLDANEPPMIFPVPCVQLLPGSTSIAEKKPHWNPLQKVLLEAFLFLELWECESRSWFLGLSVQLLSVKDPAQKYIMVFRCTSLQAVEPPLLCLFQKWLIVQVSTSGLW